MYVPDYRLSVLLLLNVGGVFPKRELFSCIQAFLMKVNHLPSHFRYTFASREQNPAALIHNYSSIYAKEVKEEEEE